MKISKFISRFIKGIDEVLFPSVCLACGVERTLPEQYLCPFCRSHGFEEANPQDRMNASGEILPAGVSFQDALWNYQKGGGLQNLMYHLKYDKKSKLGIELGILTALRFKQRGFSKKWLRKDNSILIIPVPLHPAKMRLRGFNQARKVARGIADVLDLAIVDEGVVGRKKSTVTQTGFSLVERMKNLKTAFSVESCEAISKGCHLIVDDVFTTGTTVFELAHQLRLKGSKGVGILTVAQA